MSAVTYPLRPRDGADFTGSVLNRDTRFAAEPKIDGIRFMANLNTHEVYNRKGEPLKDAAEYISHLVFLRATMPAFVEWVDCESLGRYTGQTRALFVLDIIISETTYSERRAIMESLPGLPIWNMDAATIPAVCLVPRSNPKDMWNRCLEARPLVEGIVLKALDSFYDRQLVTPDRVASRWVKFRFDHSVCEPVENGRAPLVVEAVPVVVAPPPPVVIHEIPMPLNANGDTVGLCTLGVVPVEDAFLEALSEFIVAASDAASMAARRQLRGFGRGHDKATFDKTLARLEEQMASLRAAAAPIFQPALASGSDSSDGPSD